MKLFTPVIKLMNRIKFLGKFSLIGGILAVPIIIMMFLLISNMNDELSQLEKRKTGSLYNQLLKDLLQDVQQHRAMAVGFLGGDASFEQQMAYKQKEITTDIKKIDDFEKHHEGEYSSDQWEEIKGGWSSIASSVNNMTASQATQAHIEYIASLLEYMVLISDKSDLLLSDTNQGMNLALSTVETLPKLTERLGQMRAKGMSAVTSGQLDGQTQTDLVALNSLVNESMASLEHQMNVIFADRELKSTLNELNNTAVTDTNLFLDVLDKQVIDANTITINSEDYYNLATNTIDRSFDLYIAGVNELVRQMDENINQVKTARNLTISLITVAIFLVVYGFLGFYFSIRNNIVKLKDVAVSVAEGDLTKEVSLQTRDEMNDIEQAFNEMTGSLRILVNQITNNAEQVAAASEELTASSGQTTLATEYVASAVSQISQGADKQLDGINESHMALEEISTGVQLIADYSGGVSDLTTQTASHAEEGAKSIQLNLNQMNNIHSSVEESNRIIHTLHQSSQQIGDILTVITGIAHQTNLLALNASIEAARAGEMGKGFAVVADEVKKLAQQSQTSSLQIAELIKGIQNNTEKSVEVMTDVTKNVESGLTISREVATKFEEILKGMQEISPQIQEVSATALQMSTGTQQVVSGVEEIANISKENSSFSEEVVVSTQEQLASMEQITSAAKVLTQMADDLQKVVRKFKI